MSGWITVINLAAVSAVGLFAWWQWRKRKEAEALLAKSEAADVADSARAQVAEASLGALEIERAKAITKAWEDAQEEAKNVKDPQDAADRLNAAFRKLH